MIMCVVKEFIPYRLKLFYYSNYMLYYYSTLQSSMSKCVAIHMYHTLYLPIKIYDFPTVKRTPQSASFPAVSIKIFCPTPLLTPCIINVYINQEMYVYMLYIKVTKSHVYFKVKTWLCLI